MNARFVFFLYNKNLSNFLSGKVDNILLSYIFDPYLKTAISGAFKGGLDVFPLLIFMFIKNFSITDYNILQFLNEKVMLFFQWKY